MSQWSKQAQTSILASGMAQKAYDALVNADLNVEDETFASIVRNVEANYPKNYIGAFRKELRGLLKFKVQIGKMSEDELKKINI